MQPAFRWYGENGRVPLSWLRQMTPRPKVVTHLGQFAPGDEWTVDALQALRAQLDNQGLELGPVESVFWSEDMKTSGPRRDQHVEGTLQTLRNLRAVFPDVDDLIVTYHLMALDWSRTNLAFVHPNGAVGVAFDQAECDALDVSNGLNLPGWGKGFTADEFAALAQKYADRDALYRGIGEVLDALVPVAESLGIRLAAHPNDPPWPTFGLPALLCDSDDIRRFLALHPSPNHGLCYCTGSYGANPANDLHAQLREFKDSIAWLHLRVTKTTGDQVFHEADHADPDADWDLLELLKTIRDIGWDGIYRSDHGLDLLQETDSRTMGYPAIDRYVANKMIWGMWQGLTRG